MTTFLRRVIRTSPDDFINAVYLACNDVAPSYECVELGVGDSFLVKVRAVPAVCALCSSCLLRRSKEDQKQQSSARTFLFFALPFSERSRRRSSNLALAELALFFLAHRGID